VENIQNAINSLEVTLIRHGNKDLIEDVFSYKTLKTAIKALEKQAFFENQISNISDWFVDNRDCLSDVAFSVSTKNFNQYNENGKIDEVDLEFIVSDIVDEIQKVILNVLSTYKDN
jgi:hypothetical protein